MEHKPTSWLVTMTYNAELENCLIAIARKHAAHLVPVDWQKPGDLQQPPHEFAGALRQKGVLVVIGDKFDHTDETVVEAARACVALYRRLYQLLAIWLYPNSYAGSETQATFCQASDFVVLALVAPGGPIVGVLGELVTPFIIQNHAPPLPAKIAMQGLAGHILDFLETDHDSPQLSADMVGIVEAMCVMDMRPLPFMPTDGVQSPDIQQSDDRTAGHDGQQPDDQITEEFSPETGAHPPQDDDKGGALRGPVPRLQD